jgi:flavin reductase (DIM6/NTAB) family NADH-FMN oxidoreductase RutF
MAESDTRAASSLSLFWTPIVAVGAAARGRLNAQVSVSTFGASIVPQRPRLLVVLYKSNLTHDLVAASRSFALSVLRREQIELVHSLGFVSGRDRDKLAGIDYQLTARGNPVFPDSLAWLDCEAIDGFDLGDATAFLAAVLEVRELRAGSPLVWSSLRRELPQAWRDEWDIKISHDIQRSLSTMHWRRPEVL